jgi:hypothetical protein
MAVHEQSQMLEPSIYYVAFFKHVPSWDECIIVLRIMSKDNNILSKNSHISHLKTSVLLYFLEKLAYWISFAVWQFVSLRFYTKIWRILTTGRKPLVWFYFCGPHQDLKNIDHRKETFGVVLLLWATLRRSNGWTTLTAEERLAVHSNLELGSVPVFRWLISCCSFEQSARFMSKTRTKRATLNLN